MHRLLPALFLVIPALIASALGSPLPRAIRLAPPDATMTLRAYAFGLMPLDIAVDRFQGTLSYEPEEPQRCTVRLVAEVASFRTADPERSRRLVGPDFMDAARYPVLSFSGRCVSHDEISGNLEMHGVVRPLEMSLAWSPQEVRATGALRRAQWGITGAPVMVGPTIEVSLSARLPGAAP